MPCQNSERFSSRHERLQALLHWLGVHPLPRLILAPLGLVVRDAARDARCDTSRSFSRCFLTGFFKPSVLVFSFRFHRFIGIVGLSNFKHCSKYCTGTVLECFKKGFYTVTGEVLTKPFPCLVFQRGGVPRWRRQEREGSREILKAAAPRIGSLPPSQAQPLSRSVVEARTRKEG